jgi:imidazole glycerol-phosphate synthase subunit HisH
MKKKYDVAIIDYNMGNLFSLQNMCKHVGINAVITSDENVILDSTGIILPGVGAFGDAMTALSQLKLSPVIVDAARRNTPLLGICLGMQLLFTYSEEFGRFQGLGLIPGKVVKFSYSRQNKPLKVPHIGWNKVIYGGSKDIIFKNIKLPFYAYFVHSYYCSPDNPYDVLCETDYDDFQFCSGILHNNIMAFQFHPERSGETGKKIFSNFKERIGEWNG